jgi:hypothetical protein
MPRGQSSGHRALAHLLAARSIATPQQAKEPTVPTPAKRQIQLAENWTTEPFQVRI